MRILVAVDGSEQSNLAVSVVATLHWPGDTEVRVVSMIPRISSTALDWAGLDRAIDVDDEPARHHRLALERSKNDLATPGRLVETFALRGRAASAIVDEARAWQADLIVIGSRGRGLWRSMLLGSVSAEVVDHAPCPVLVVRGSTVAPILFADDGSDGARRAEAVLARWPFAPGERVDVLTVVRPERAVPVQWGAGMPTEFIDDTLDQVDQSYATAKRVADEAAVRLADGAVVTRADVIAGDPAEVIVDIANQRDVGLIVLGTRGHGGLAGLLLGSVARNVLLHAHCSVLVVRPGPVTKRLEEPGALASAAR